MRRACAPFGLGLSALLLLAVASGARADGAKAVVFYAPLTLDPELRSALEDALHAQLMQLPAELQLELHAGPAKQVESWVQELAKRARDRSAAALFWLEVRSPSRWNLYAIDPRAERIAVRPVDVKQDSPEAAIEVVALIVRASTDALLHGEALPADSSQPPQSAAANEKDRPLEPWPVVPAFEPRSALRIAAAYLGSTFARKLPWQSGLSLRAAWIWPSGPYLGAGFTFFGTAEFVRKVRFQVDRYPIALFAGLRFPVDRFTFTGELGAEIEFRKRRTPDAREYTPKEETSQTIYSICPKLEAEYSLTSWFRIFVNSGLDFVLGNFPYVRCSEPSCNPALTIPVVEPHWLRLTMQVGVGIIR